MYIIVVGGGRVGYYLSKALLEEGHEVLVIEKSQAYCDIINEELGSICVRGDGCETSLLAEVGTARANMLIAVTGDDGDNLVSCQVAKHKFNVPRTIARIRNPRNEILFKKLGIDITISSTNVILEQITDVVPTHPVTHLHEIRDKGLEIVEVKIPQGAASVGKAIKDINFPAGTILTLIIRKAQKPVVPSPTTVIMAEDQIVAVIDPLMEGDVRKALRGMS
ncbi:MAG: TrkA family potassium uptake protein [Dehalococcoidales bacterium]|nr:TrkA family potassium uptake protein [Dehalococcoidales bacterium]